MRHGLETCSRAATLVSRKIGELPSHLLLMFGGTETVAKSESELDLELEGPFVAPAVTLKRLAASAPSCFLYE